MLTRIITVALAFAALAPATAGANEFEPLFDSSYFNQQQNYQQEKKQKREEGYVLQRFHDPASGKPSGQLSLGGGAERAPQYGAPTTYNFGPRDPNEEQGGILNLRLKF
jgi:hypothetical protein